MALNFPANPTINEEYTFASKTWVWNGLTWSLKVGQAQNLLDTVKSVDGEGSGLDADLLDGKHASEFYLASNPSNFTSNAGTVTSVDISLPTGLSVSGNPIIESGTLTIVFAVGYSIPTTTNQSNWSTAYSWGDHAVAGYLNSSSIGVTVQAYDPDLTTWAAKVAPTGSVVGTSDAQTLSNKNIQERVIFYPNSPTLTIDGDATDIADLVTTQAAGTLTVALPTGTPFDGQKLMLKIKSTNVQTFAWNAVFVGSTDLPMPVSTSGSSKYDYLGFVYNSTAAKWHLIAKNFGF